MSACLLFANCIFLNKLFCCFSFRDPNDHDDKPDSGSKERNRFRSVTWDEYDPVHQKYLEISEYPYLLIS